MTFHSSRIDFFGLGPINMSSLSDSLRPFGWPARLNRHEHFPQPTTCHKVYSFDFSSCSFWRPGFAA